ncbi:tetratricopeptide repeat protein, partial [Rivihabitans pingtungensis]|uniref:tetratricopeptide repeat protein n=1 Tax=Rivihabitans pingtungensis TaxID=1054498 RepID=UPI002CEF5023
MSEPTAPDLAAQLQAAIAHHQAGELAEAEQGYRAILAEQANHPDAWHNLGILALQVEQHDTALELLRGVLQAYPQHGQFWISYLQALMRIGQFDLARAVLAQGRELGLDGEPVDAIARQLELLPGAAPDTPGEATSPNDTAAQTDTPTQEETPTAAETA